MADRTQENKWLLASAAEQGLKGQLHCCLLAEQNPHAYPPLPRRCCPSRDITAHAHKSSADTECCVVTRCATCPVILDHGCALHPSDVQAMQPNMCPDQTLRLIVLTCGWIMLLLNSALCWLLSAVALLFGSHVACIYAELLPTANTQPGW